MELLLCYDTPQYWFCKIDSFERGMADGIWFELLAVFGTLYTTTGTSTG